MPLQRTVKIRTEGKEKIENSLKHGVFFLPHFQFSFVCLEDCVSGELLRTDISLWRDPSFLLHMKQMQKGGGFF